MSFCIECGARLPDKAKFCPQCGAEVLPIEAAATDAKPDNTVPEVIEDDKATLIPETGPDKTEIESPDSDDIESIDTAPSVLDSLAASAAAVPEDPQSKTGLFVGVGFAALLACGGGAYALGLFGGGDRDSAKSAATPVISTPTPLPASEMLDDGAGDVEPVLAAYQNAIKTGRISDLGQFAIDHPDSSLAQDAQDAAFASLNRQSSVLAYTTFAKFFPNADTSTYTGPRVNTDISAETAGAETIASDENASGENIEAAPSTIRSTLITRTEELEPFIAQGDTGYAVAVIDDLLSLTDLTESEATYLLNLRARAETSIGFTAPANLDAVPTEVDPALDVQPASLEVTTAAANAELAETAQPDVTTAIEEFAETEIQPETITPAEIAASEPALPYDTPAKPVERFGAITPDEATEPGECDMTFSVDVTGAPTNINAACTDPIFIQPATETVGDWLYSAASLNGVPVQQDNVVVKIKFHLE